MKLIEDTKEREIFNALISRRTTFEVGGVQFKERLIEGTKKERERKARAKAKVLIELLKL